MAAASVKQLKRVWVHVGGKGGRLPDGTPTPILIGSMLRTPDLTTVPALHLETVQAIGRFVAKRLGQHTAQVALGCTCGRSPPKLFFVEVALGKVIGPWCGGCVYWHILNTLDGQVRDDLPVYVIPVKEGLKWFAKHPSPPLVEAEAVEPATEPDSTGAWDPPPF